MRIKNNHKYPVKLGGVMLEPGVTEVDNSKINFELKLAASNGSIVFLDRYREEEMTKLDVPKHVAKPKVKQSNQEKHDSNEPAKFEHKEYRKFGENTDVPDGDKLTIDELSKLHFSKINGVACRMNDMKHVKAWQAADSRKYTQKYTKRRIEQLESIELEKSIHESLGVLNNDTED